MLDQHRLSTASNRQLISLLAVILSGIGASDITIHNNTEDTSFVCNDVVTFSCDIDPVPSFGMLWVFNGTKIVDCFPGFCLPESASPAYISYAVWDNGKAYNLTINPISTNLNDVVLECVETSSTATSKVKVAIPIAEGSTTMTDSLIGSVANISVTTGCIFPYGDADIEMDLVTSNNVSIGTDVELNTQSVEGSDCSASSDCHGKFVTKYITFTELNDAEATDIYVKLNHNGKTIYRKSTNKFRIAKCNSTQILCDETKLCVNKCDGKKNCSDGSDERNCASQNTTVNTIGSTKTSKGTSDTTQSPTISITTSDTHNSNSSTNNTTNDGRSYAMHDSFIYLIVGGGLLLCLFALCVIHVVYISVKGKIQKDKYTQQQTNHNLETQT